MAKRSRSCLGIEYLFDDNCSLFTIFQFSTHTELYQWIQTCRHVCQFVKKHIPEFFIVNHWISLELNVQQFSKDGNLKCVQYLWQKGVNIHADDQFAFRMACENGHLEMVKFFVSKGANPFHEMNSHKFNEKTWKPKMSGLIRACSKGHTNVVEFLVSQGANIHTDNELPLVCACENGHLEMVKFLVSKGADIFISYYAPLRLAIQNNHLNLVQFLVSQVKIQSISKGKTPPKTFPFPIYENQLLVNACECGHLEMVKYLVEEGADIHEKSDFAIYRANAYNRFDIVCFLLKKGANMHACGSTLVKACKHNQFEMVLYLLKKGTNIHFDNESPLIAACEGGHFNIARLLIEWVLKFEVPNGTNFYEYYARVCRVLPFNQLDILIPLLSEGFSIQKKDVFNK